MKRQKLEKPDDLGSKKQPDQVLDEFRSELIIDKHSLDDAIVAQPHLFFRVSEIFTEKMNDRDILKDRVKRLNAKLDQLIRKRAAEDGDRITETAIITEILYDTGYKDLRDEYLRAEYICEKWALLKDAFNQRSYMIRDLVNLYLANYYSDVSERQVTTGATGEKRSEELSKRHGNARKAARENRS